MVLALLFLFFCLTVGSVVLTAASGAAGRTTRNRQQQQDYLAVASAAKLLQADLQKAQLVGVYYHDEIETITEIMVEGTPNEDGTPGEPVPDYTVSHSKRDRDATATLTGTRFKGLTPFANALDQLFASTTPVAGHTAPSSIRLQMTIDPKELSGGGNLNLPPVKGTLTVAVAENTATGTDLYSMTLLLTDDKGQNATTLYLDPQVPNPPYIEALPRNTSVSGDTTTHTDTTKITRTIAWPKVTIVKGVPQ